ncbi:MAG: ferritin-like domain-containing protein [Phycisphaeraceae bacterium]
MPMKSLSQAFVDELKDVYSAEKQLTHALPKMAEGASNEQLKAAFKQHLEQTGKQVERLEQVFASLDRAVDSKQCLGMKGIVDEGQELMGEDAAPDVRDAMLIEAAQKVEHYEIAAYGTLCTWADMLGYSDASELLKSTLAEEKQTDDKLTELAEQVVNRQALKAA